MTPAKRTTPKLPKPDEVSKKLFHSIVPDHPDVKVRPMFGQLSAFVHGNMFMGIYGSDVFLRLPEEDRSAIERAGGGPFEPMPGRPMKEYIVLPAAWRREPRKLEEWVARSLDWAEGLPPKRPKRKPKTR